MKQPFFYLKRITAGFFISAWMMGGQMAFGQQSFDLAGAIKSLKKGEATTVQIPAGKHKLPPGGLKLEGLKDVTIEGKGATLLACDNSSAISLYRCENITLRGFEIDYDPMLFTQGTITSLTGSDKSFEFELHKGYPDLGDKFLVNRFHLFSKDKPHWKPGSPDYYVNPIERIDSRHGRIRLQAGDEAGFAALEEGDRIVIATKAAAAITFFDLTRGTKVEDVTVYSGGGGVLARFAEDSGEYRRLRLIPGPKPEGATEPRLMSTTADAFNIAYTRRGPVLDECEFSYQGDDGVNLHGVIFPIVENIDSTSFYVMRPGKKETWDKVVRAGDVIRFLQGPDYRVKGEAKITAFGMVEPTEKNLQAFLDKAKQVWTTMKVRDNQPTVMKITVDKPVVMFAGADFCEIPVTAAEGYAIRNSYFHDHRGRGLRLMASDGVVENNRFERLKGGGISVGGELGFWREAGWCQNVIIKNNQLNDVWTAKNLTMPSNSTLGIGAISVGVRIEESADGKIPSFYDGNENIQILNNVIDGCITGGIVISAAQGVKIEGNKISNAAMTFPANKQPNIAYQLGKDKDLILIQSEGTLEGKPFKE